MADDLKRKGPEDPRQINMNQEHEVRYWTQKWNITREQLVDAILRADSTYVYRVAAILGKPS